MKIAINAVRVSRLSGGGMDHYVIHLVNGLARLGADFDLYTFSPGHFTEVAPERIIHPFTLSRGGKRSSPPNAGALNPAEPHPLRMFLARTLGDWVKMFWTQFIFPFRLAMGDYDVLFSPSQMDALPFSPVRQVIAVLDLIPRVLKTRTHKHRFYLKFFFPTALKNSARVITISENTKRDVIRFFGLPAERITAILLAKPGEEGPRPAVSQEEVRKVRERHGLGKYVLCVSGNDPHKNIACLIEAFAILRDKTDCPLVVAGYQDASAQVDLDRRVRERQLGGRVKFLGHVSSEELRGLFVGAEIFVFPSLYEGFGFPVLEALSYGLSVISSGSSSLPEVGGDAAVYFNPEDPKELAEKMAELLSDPVLRGRMRERALEQAKKFSWEETARQTLAALTQAALG